MIVFSDATPINHLIRAELIFILPELLGSVVIPESVADELQADEPPEIVKNFISDRPEWLRIHAPEHIFDIELDELDKGERDAILLVEELKADLLLIDERKGRKVALDRNLPVTGTVAMIERASMKGLIDFYSSLAKLKTTGFYLSAGIENKFIERARQRENET